METEDFFDYVVEEGEVFEVVVLKGLVSENAFLFLIQFLTKDCKYHEEESDRGQGGKDTCILVWHQDGE